MDNGLRKIQLKQRRTNIMSKSVVCIGYGWVNKQTAELFPDAKIYDPYIDQGNFTEEQWREIRPRLVTQGKVSEYDVAVIAVPTPNLPDGSLDTSIVEEIVSWCECPIILIRSTLNPGTVDYLTIKYKKRIVVQPEYLGESVQHVMASMKERNFIILGGEPKDRREIIELYTQAYNANVTIRQVTARVAEVIKLSENRAIAFKVAQCQELYDACEAAGIDYYEVRDAVYSDDPRFNLWWTFIFPDNRGMNSKCIPKDPKAWVAWCKQFGYDPKITKAILSKNEEWLEHNRAAHGVYS